MSVDEADRAQQAQNLYDRHTAVWLNASATCTQCGEAWPCRPVKAVLPLLATDAGFRL